MAEQEQDRSEAATPHKLEEARKKGSLAKSVEVGSAFILAAWLGTLYLAGEKAAGAQARLDISIFGQAHRLSFTEAGVLSWLSKISIETLSLLAPFLFAVVVAAIVGSWVQNGPVLTVHPIKPDFNRINPAQGLKRLMSLRALFDLGKNALKLVLFGWVLFVVLSNMLGPLLGLMQMDPTAYGQRLYQDLTGLLFKLLMALAAVALLDVLFTRWDFAKKMRMSRREVKQEHRQREGDPKIKARIRELQNEMRKRGKGMQNLPDADVLLTNPTHLAVALKYKQGEMAAPQIVAKGAGDLVPKMKHVARSHGVMIIENKRLARALFKVGMDSPVPADLYPDVARILVWVYTQREARRKAAIQQGTV